MSLTVAWILVALPVVAYFLALWAAWRWRSAWLMAALIALGIMLAAAGLLMGLDAGLAAISDGRHIIK